MKKFALYTAAALSLLATACNKDDNNTTTTTPKATVLTGALASQTLTADKTYLLQGTVIVGDGQTLTIEPGTVILGDKGSKGTLVIDRGGKLMAEGTASNPIVFTSEQDANERSRGDWGGIIMLGKAPINQATGKLEGLSTDFFYGGTVADDNSGVLKYVRIEFAGITLSPDNETNGLTMAGVGSGTTIDYVQVSYGGDDAFEWFGGTVNAKHLVSLGTWDDDFDCDFGYTGKVQFAVAFRERDKADQSGSNGFEIDNDATGSTTATPKTAPIFSNVSIFGPRTDSNAISGNYTIAQSMHLRRNSAASIRNSYISGWSRLLYIDGATTLGNYTGGTGTLANNLLVVSGGKKGNTATVYPTATGNNTAADQMAYVEDASRANTVQSVNAIPFSAFGLNQNAYARFNTADTYGQAPNVTVTGGDLNSGANFTGLPAFFENVAYKGAFGATDWTSGWASFTPNQNEY